MTLPKDPVPSVFSLSKSSKPAVFYISTRQTIKYKKKYFTTFIERTGENKININNK